MLERSRNLNLGVVILALVVAPVVSAQDTPDPEVPPISIEQFLPVASRTMAVGPFDAEHRSTGIVQPFFIVGCDEVSLEWIEINHSRLLDLKAFGLVVNAPDLAAYERLEQAAEGLLIRPVVGDLLAEHLGITRYPALVTADGIFP
jgi:integrating conjugative element protein (TIGR03765 family)